MKWAKTSFQFPEAIKLSLVIVCVVFAVWMLYQIATFVMSFSKHDKIKVEPFLAFGNDTEVFFKGRVINAYKQRRPSSRNNWISNIAAAIKRYSGSSVANAMVEITFQHHSVVVSTDENGVFELHIEDVKPILGQHEVVTFKVLEPVGKKTQIAHLEVARYSGNIGVISDIDDTIIISHSTEIGKKFWLSISKNAYTRRPLPGVSAFYKKITEDNTLPIFYVSSSDWSLFDLVKDFLRYRHIPEGPILLKDNHINLRNIWKSGGGDHDHKFKKLEIILKMYPKMRFYLIGDSGQQDPEIYARLIDKYPGRIKDVFIRVVGKVDLDRQDKFENLENFEHFHFIHTSEEAIEIATEESIIH
jgi:phosphatidate phosphatase APP1